jgi:molybdopterin-containing oxidoreductase family iron-sulfur binding subunit
MEKCTFCIQRIRRTKRTAARDNGDTSAERILGDPELERALSPACVNACPTETLVFGDLFEMLSARRAGERLPKPKNKAQEIVKKELEEGRGYRILEEKGTNPSVIYLRKVDKESREAVSHG